MIQPSRNKRVNRAYKILLHGEPKVGKTTFCAGLPKPVFIRTEDGLANIDVDAFPLCDSIDGEVIGKGTQDASSGQVFDVVKGYNKNSESSLMNQLRSLCNLDYQTVVIDSIDWLQALTERVIIAEWNSGNSNKIKALSDIPYGRLYGLLSNRIETILGLFTCSGLEYLYQKKQMNIVLIAHTKIEKIELIDGTQYDMYTPLLDKRINGIVKQWSDMILFACKNTSVKQNRNNKFIAETSDRRLVTSGNAMILAESRYMLPPELPLDAEAFWNELNGNDKT